MTKQSIKRTKPSALPKRGNFPRLSRPFSAMNFSTLRAAIAPARCPCRRDDIRKASFDNFMLLRSQELLSELQPGVSFSRLARPRIEKRAHHPPPRPRRPVQESQGQQYSDRCRKDQNQDKPDFRNHAATSEELSERNFHENHLDANNQTEIGQSRLKLSTRDEGKHQVRHDGDGQYSNDGQAPWAASDDLHAFAMTRPRQNVHDHRSRRFFLCSSQQN